MVPGGRISGLIQYFQRLIVNCRKFVIQMPNACRKYSLIYDLQKIRDSLPASGMFSAGGMYYFNEIESTNTWLIRQAEVDGKFCIAGHQTAGRGRRGKTWISREGGAILLSMGWKLEKPYVPGLSLVSGLAVIAALQESGIDSASLISC